jgi:hypothetical protein
MRRLRYKVLMGALLLALAGMALTAGGCKTDSGSREYLPGKGWRPA